MQLVIFDCDGVLVDSEGIVNRTESDYFTELGFAISPQEAMRRFKGKTTEQVALAVEEACGPLPPDWQFDWGIRVARDLVRELRPVDGVLAVIEAAQSAGLKTCVGSQSPLARVELSLQLTGLAHYFGPNVFTASMVARPKPAPDLFLHAARAMGAEPHACIVIEDSPSGVAAARAAGMTVFGYAAAEDPSALEREGALVFTSMRQLAIGSAGLQIADVKEPEEERHGKGGERAARHDLSDGVGFEIDARPAHHRNENQERQRLLAVEQTE